MAKTIKFPSPQAMEQLGKAVEQLQSKLATNPASTKVKDVVAWWKQLPIKTK